MIKYFEGNPTRNTLKVLEEDERPGVFYYKFDDQNVKNSDITQILGISLMILGSFTDLHIRQEPISKKQAEIFLCIKNRTDIKLGIYNYSR